MKVYKYVLAAAFAALIAVSGFFIVPLPGGVPIVLKNLFVVLAGMVLGGFYGGIAVLIFLAAGLVGIPVFVIPGGPAVFLTPLGGYLAGYFVGSLTAGLISGRPSVSEKKTRLPFIIRLCIASFLGFALIDLCGALYLMLFKTMSFKAALVAGVVPFIIGDAIKFALSVPLALKLRPLAARYVNPDSTVSTSNEGGS
jgi:biotin transport system substrate-specific component